jgi:hypothetical protein
MRWTRWCRETSALKRTAKACGPGAPTLALRSRVYPADDGGKKARSPGRSRISRKTIAWGMPDVSGASAVNTRVHTKTTKRTRGCGCIGHPAFPAPSDFLMAQLFRKPRTHRAARMRWCVSIWLFENSGCLKARANPSVVVARHPVRPSAGRMTGSGGAIQYAAASRSCRAVSGILGRPPSRAMTAEWMNPQTRHCEPTGPREARPDDRLREAIHLAAERKSGLLRRVAPRNDGLPISAAS